MLRARVQREDLLPRIARGESDAVQACLDRYGSLVWTLCRRLHGNLDTAEDLVQEIFIDVWKSATRFDARKASETTFIATIARRRIIDQSRRAARAPVSESFEEANLPEEEEAFEALDLGDEARRAKDALEQLKPEERRVIQMSVVEGLTHPEIAVATGLPLGTVKSHIRRGLEKAARKLSRGGSS